MRARAWWGRGLYAVEMDRMQEDEFAGHGKEEGNYSNEHMHVALRCRRALRSLSTIEHLTRMR